MDPIKYWMPRIKLGGLIRLIPKYEHIRISEAADTDVQAGTDDSLFEGMIEEFPNHPGANELKERVVVLVYANDVGGLTLVVGPAYPTDMKEETKDGE